MQTARKFFTFLVGAAIFIGRSIKHDAVPSKQDADSALDAGLQFFVTAEARGLAPTDEDL